MSQHVSCLVTVGSQNDCCPFLLCSSHDKLGSELEHRGVAPGCPPSIPPFPTKGVGIAGIEQPGNMSRSEELPKRDSWQATLSLLAWDNESRRHTSTEYMSSAWDSRGGGGKQKGRHVVRSDPRLTAGSPLSPKEASCLTVWFEVGVGGTRIFRATRARYGGRHEVEGGCDCDVKVLVLAQEEHENSPGSRVQGPRSCHGRMIILYSVCRS
jgi:hypothetical protein